MPAFQHHHHSWHIFKDTLTIVSLFGCHMTEQITTCSSDLLQGEHAQQPDNVDPLLVKP